MLLKENCNTGQMLRPQETTVRRVDEAQGKEEKGNNEDRNRAGIFKIKNKQRRKINESKSWFFEKSHKMDKPRKNKGRKRNTIRMKEVHYDRFSRI